MSDPKTPPIPVKVATYHYGEDKDHAVSQDVAISMEVIDDRLSLFVDSTSYKGDITGRLTLNREAAHTLGRALIDFAHPTRPGRVNLAMSLPAGRTYGGNACKTIVREASFEVIDETAKPDTDIVFDIDTLILGLPETGPQIRQLLDNALKR